MDLHKRMNAFYKRWDIEDIKSFDEKFLDFKKRVLNLFQDIDSNVADESIKDYCNLLAIRYDLGSFTHSRYIYYSLDEETNLKRFLCLVELILSLVIYTDDNYGYITYSKDLLVSELETVINYSDVGIRLVRNGSSVLLYPAGEQLLDENVVNSALSFLEGKASEHFSDALKFYQQGTGKSYVKCLESLRRTIEEYLRMKNGSIKNVKMSIRGLKKQLGGNASNTMLATHVQAILSYLENNFFNANSKHNDGDFNEVECEFLIYEVALLLRYLDRIMI